MRYSTIISDYLNSPSSSRNLPHHPQKVVSEDLFCTGTMLGDVGSSVKSKTASLVEKLCS